MKHSIKIVMGSALMLALPLLLTSCEDVLGHWEKPTPVIPAPLGSVENPYSISTSADWDAFAAKVNGGETNIHAKQTGDISGVTTVIGTEANPFKGTYDGQGFKISDINITGDSHLGLFGYVSSPDAVIQNVVVASGTVTGAGRSYGAIVGTLHEGKVDHCVNYADISSSYSSDEAGARIGGIVGWSYGDNTAVNTITNCINFGNISATGAKGSYAGGIVGCFGIATHGLGDTVEHCQNYGKISTTYGIGIGGIIGFFYVGSGDHYTVKNNHNGGNLVNTAASENSNNIIWGGNFPGESAVDPSNTYWSSMTLTLSGALKTLSTYAHGATAVDSNPEGITIGSKTYTKE